MLHSSANLDFYSLGGYPLLSSSGSLTTKSFTGRIWRQKTVFFVDMNGAKYRDMNGPRCHDILHHFVIMRCLHVTRNILQCVFLRGYSIFLLREIPVESITSHLRALDRGRSNAQIEKKKFHKKHCFLPSYPPRETFCCQTATR